MNTHYDSLGKRTLPHHVHRDKRYGVVHRKYLGRVDGRVKWGKRTKLASYDADLPTIWRAWVEAEMDGRLDDRPAPVKRFKPFPHLPYNHKLNTAWAQAKRNARNRGIPFHFSKQEWYEWWGDDIHKRGRNAGDLCMCRIGDAGAYHPLNVYKGTMSENGVEVAAKRWG